MRADDRAKLAEQQAALVDALAGRSPVPDGFDAQHIATAAASLLAKRRRGVEKTWPGLAASLGERFRTIFVEYARSHPIPADGPAADGRLFARYLRGLGLLSDAVRIQLLLADMGRWPIAIAYLPARARSRSPSARSVAPDGSRFGSFVSAGRIFHNR